MKLKKRMTFDEMAAHLVENTGKVANRVTVGRYAKKLGYTVYKPMINRKIRHCYLNEAIREETEDVKQENAKEEAYFYQVYKGLTIGFGMYEAIFMAYMADLAERRNRGYVTVYGLKKHLEATGMGRRIFERCVSKTTRMGLLERVPVDSKYDYVWDMAAYRKLVGIVSGTNDFVRLHAFCDEMFEKRGLQVMSVTDDEIRRLKEGR